MRLVTGNDARAGSASWMTPGRGLTSAGGGAMRLARAGKQGILAAARVPSRTGPVGRHELA